MDFMVGMPTHQGQTVILVVIDQFSKAAHFRSLTTHFSTCKTVEVFMQMNCNTLGTLRVLSPSETRFSSANFSFQINGTKLRINTAYHPQTNGQTEILTLCLQQYLRSFIHEKPSDWLKFLYLVEWSYNTTIHNSMG